ncbi:MAG: UvrB/UvrC motif-containing protein [Oscillospiraceae bacterium]|nr:UvrB/UvrC motif-containing protein [Oscillospiraceae bacterium]
MKCQKCGNNEVNFSYSSNINGNVSETNLCSKCATESGYDIEKLFNNEHNVAVGEMFEKMFAIPKSNNGLMSMAIPMIPTSAVFPFVVRPTSGMIEERNSNSCGCGQHTTHNQNADVDEDMKMRRELNAQMREAIANEEFEKAAVLRDKIKMLGTQETGGSQKCDTEKNSQDSANAQ